MTRRTAPPLEVDTWLQGGPLTLDDLRGQVVVIETFQMLCPGCVAYGLPLAQRIHAWGHPDIAVIGLHTVFEHHEVMGRTALAAFVGEYRLRFPIAIDRPSDGDVPRTMQRYGLRGTPSTVVIDRQGNLAGSHFGQVDEIALGVELGQLLAETVEPASPPHTSDLDGSTCQPGQDCT